MEMLLYAIFHKIQKDPSDFQAYEDLYHICLEAQKAGARPLAAEYLEKLSDALEKVIPTIKDIGNMRKMFALHREVVFAGAQDSFHCCLLAVEWNRDPEKKFYVPRMGVLREVVQALQDLEDGKLDLAAISLPPGAGKTTLAIFYLTWIAGRHPEEPTLTGSHSNSFVRGVYDECLRIFDPNGEYLWHEVFPTVQVVNTNAKDCRIDLGKRKRFETLEFTSIGTGNAGLYRAMHLLYCDDLVSGIEVALNKERLDKLWETYTTDLRQRKIGDHCGELHIATRWSVHDVIGRLEAMYGDSPRARFIVIPAMDDNDESNFDYAYGVGFNTQFYRQQRDIMDDASWRALYMNQPIERDGLLFQEDELRRYFELPSEDPDAIIAVCDTKDKGTDYAVQPVAFVYGQDYYIDDCICDNGLPEIVDARLAEILVRNKVKMARFESNSAGRRVAEKVQQMVKDQGGITHITTKYTTANKETKIIVNSAWVKQHCLFKDQTTYKRNSEYGKFINMLCSYTMAGKNKNDDVPDAMAMLAEYAQSLTTSKVEVFQRPW
ncbi:MAG: phage terminase large subunit [Bacteroidales bacterium]|nr:phage terminase large subunit [Bacteroidales bacterium]